MGETLEASGRCKVGSRPRFGWRFETFTDGSSAGGASVPAERIPEALWAAARELAREHAAPATLRVWLGRAAGQGKQSSGYVPNRSIEDMLRYPLSRISGELLGRL